jgi:hypothetical protein
VVALRGAEGSVLVVDRDAVTLAERRLVAHLAADEPASNAQLICAHYLGDASRGHCRAVLASDLEVSPSPDDPVEPANREAPLVDDAGYRYGLEPVHGSRSIPDLRWVARGSSAREAALSLREVVGRLQSYEPARSVTRAALARHRADPSVSVCSLRAELERVNGSRIVLNRGLREAVLNAMRVQELSASEIAIRCGRVKRDARGNVTGETSWLARRVGLAPESGEQGPTPWIHSDVLGLIARRGLGLSPLEVELG